MAFSPEPCLVPGQTTKISGSYRPSDKKPVLLWDLDYLFEKKQDVPGSKGQETMITGTVVRCGVCCRMESRLEQAREMAVSQPLGVTLKLTWAGSLSGRMRMGAQLSTCKTAFLWGLGHQPDSCHLWGTNPPGFCFPPWNTRFR